MEEVKVDLAVGGLVLKKPKAGMRNKAMINADTGTGINQMKFLVELMPYCVKAHPFGTQPVRDALDNLSFEDYDKLVDALGLLVNKPQESDVQGKSEAPSGQKDSPQTNG